MPSADWLFDDIPAWWIYPGQNGSGTRASRGKTVELVRLAETQVQHQALFMFTVDEPTAEVIRRVFEESGDLASIVEFKRYFPLIGDHDQARMCVRAILSWTPQPADAQRVRGRKRPPPS